MEKEDRRAVQDRIGAVLVILALVLSLATVGLIFYYVTLPPPPEPEPSCDSHHHPTVDLEAMEILAGHRFEITVHPWSCPLEFHRAAVLKNASVLFSSANVTEGVMGAILGGENLNFTDSNGDGELTTGDYFTLERLEPASAYELVLIWRANGNVIASKTVHTP